jgi:hypothetical protein
VKSSPVKPVKPPPLNPPLAVKRLCDVWCTVADLGTGLAVRSMDVLAWLCRLGPCCCCWLGLWQGAAAPPRVPPAPLKPTPYSEAVCWVVVHADLCTGLAVRSMGVLSWLFRLASCCC